MVKLPDPCGPPVTNREKLWPYEEYYIGERDEEQRKSGYGENHWIGAKSIETYTGAFLRDTMHGVGEYRWRFHGPEGCFSTYEGLFYANRMHGYGVMSYDDGRVFKGLYWNDVRWGPGVQSHAHLAEDVGLWSGTQLIRLAWMPTLTPIPDLNSHPEGKRIIESLRTVLTTASKNIGEVNSAMDLLKHLGADPVVASKKWPELYAKTCTDQESVLCYRDAFEKAYYGKSIRYLDERDSNIKDELSSSLSKSSREKGRSPLEDGIKYFAWNNNAYIKQMMNHCFKHDFQRDDIRLNLAHILSGKRNEFKPPGEYEMNCRNFLMACFVGNVSAVTSYVVDSDIHPNISDSQGNTALMYATAGNHETLVRFLVEAGAQVNQFNDACVTALSVTIINYLATQRGISHAKLVEALLSSNLRTSGSKGSRTPAKEIIVTEWNMTRAIMPGSVGIMGTRSERSLKKMRSTLKRNKSSVGKPSKMKVQSKVDITSKVNGNTSIHSYYDAKTLEIYSKRDMLSLTVPYLFEVQNITNYVTLEEEFRSTRTTTHTTIAKNKSTIEPISKRMSKAKLKASRDTLSYMSTSQRDIDNESISTRIVELERIVSTIQELLSLGADPKLVKCPQPALVMALSTENTKVIQLLIDHGVDVNATYPQFYGYTAIDIMVNRSLSQDTLLVMKILLENGAKVNHRVPFASSDLVMLGPTLLHVVLARNIEDEFQENVCNEMITMLLNHGCDASAFFNNRSALDVAMSKIKYLDVFIKNPNVNLNAIINNLNQTVLVKLLSLQYFKMLEPAQRQDILTNLILHGADPLLKCLNDKIEYPNLLVYMKEIYDKIAPKDNISSPQKTDKIKKPDKTKPQKSDTKVKGSKIIKTVKVDDSSEYKLAIELVTECARILHTRWIQAVLVKELLEIIVQFKNRSWHLIMKEHKYQKNARLWLTASRCLHIWDLLKSTKKSIYQDNAILRTLLCIIHYYNTKHKLGPKLTFQEKEQIEEYVYNLIREFKGGVISSELSSYQTYVKPELYVKAQNKFNVCFDCYLPLPINSIRCVSCKLVSFCNMECMEQNCNRLQAHPCSAYLVKKYFSPTPSIKLGE